MKWIVYCTTNVINNKVYYGVHKTENPEIFDGYIGNGIKINNPASYMDPTTPFQAAVKKYGTSNFKRTTVKIFDDAKSAYDLESIIVDKDFIKRTDVYNAHIGGCGGSSYFRKIYQYDLDGKYLREWDMILDASDFYGVSHTAIRNAAECGYSSKRFFWSFDKFENGTDVSDKTVNTGTRCYKYDGETLKFIDSYETFPQASKANNICMQSLERAVKGGYKCDGNYYSTVLLDSFSVPEKLVIKNKPFYIYGLDGEFIIELPNPKAVCEYFGVKSISSITTAIRCKRPYKEFQISLEKVDKMEPVINKRNISKKVIQYTMSGEYVATFDSITAAKNVFGEGVAKVLKGQQSHCKHFIFRFE